MISKKIVVTVLQRVNSVWFGKGTLASGDISDGRVVLTMTSGLMEGFTGAFNLEDVIFEVEREQG